MNPLQKQNRQAIRAAMRIHEHLLGAQKAELSPLPTGSWETLRKNFEQYEDTQKRGWQAASHVLAFDLDFELHRLAEELESLRRQLSTWQQPMLICQSSMIAADLLALSSEFEDICIDLKEKVIRVDTPSIVLEEIDLGPFQIVLHWERIGSGRTYQVRALEPNSPAGRSDVTHPHVENHTLCEGAGATAITKALASGRLLDFFLLVRQILETYNSGSPYVSLDDWSEQREVSCQDCGWEMSSEDGSSCERCDANICHDCSCCCEDCVRYVCSDCTERCAGCDKEFCEACLHEAAESEQSLCRNCLQRKEDQANEENENNTPADTVCLGEVTAAA